MKLFKCAILSNNHNLKVGRNICHGSDSVESANHEIGLWFTPAELNEWTQAMNSWINEGN